MFDNYPKNRTELPQSYLEIYNEHYKANRDGGTKASSIARKMESWLHKKVASDVTRINDKKTLEIGAGTLNQLEYEQSNQYDIIEPFKELFSNSPFLNKINNIFSDIDEVDLNQKYDRITSIATFEHIVNLPEVVAKACLLLDSEGTLRTSIPNEGTFLWKLGWKLTTGIEFRLKYGLNYETLMKHEHVNKAFEIDQILKYFFSQNKCYTFGLGKGFAFYRFYESKYPRLDLARKYLDT